jgi:hypothetical protein
MLAAKITAATLAMRVSGRRSSATPDLVADVRALGPRNKVTMPDKPLMLIPSTFAHARWAQRGPSSRRSHDP